MYFWIPKSSLFVAFIDLTKAFVLVSRDGLFTILSKIGCPPRLIIIRSFYVDKKGSPWSLTAQPQTFSTSEMEWNRAASSHRPYFGISLLSCWNKTLELQQRASISRPGQTKIKALQPFQTKSKVQISVCSIFSLPTMQPSPPTQLKTFSSSWTVSGRPSKILG